MTARPGWRMHAVLTLAVALLCGARGAAGAEDDLLALMDAGDLEARVVVDSAPPHMQRAPVLLAVEIASNQVFARGSRVRDFRIEGAITRPVSSFAENLTRRRKGESWTVQRWRFRVYPRNAGALKLPGLKVFVSVKNAADEIVEGELSLSAPSLKITAPAGAEQSADWLAAPALRVDERWVDEIDSYYPGDAVTRIRRFEVEDTPAMLIPGSAPEDLPGVSLYRAPAQLSDESNRGSLRGVREERLVISFESAGEYRLPGLAYRWFNTQSGQFETLQLEGKTFQVTRSATAAAGSDNTPADAQWRHSLAASFYAGLAFLLLAFLLWRFRRHPLVEGALAFLRRRMQRRRVRGAYASAISAQDSRAALSLLQQQLARETGVVRLDAIVMPPHPQYAVLQGMLAHAYGDHEACAEAGEALALYDAVLSRQRRRAARGAGHESLALNPGPAEAGDRPIHTSGV